MTVCDRAAFRRESLGPLPLRTLEARLRHLVERCPL